MTLCMVWYVLQIWSVKDPDWSCKIDEGPAGVNVPRWSPDGQSIILVADFQIRMTIWSLVKRTCLHINGPKFADRGFGFSPDGSMMALIEVCKSRKLPCSPWLLMEMLMAQ